MLADLLDLVLPRACAGCGRSGSHLCRGCTAALDVPRPHRPTPCPAGLPLLMAAGAYDGPVRVALIAHKERGRTALARPLGAALGRAVAALEPPPGTLVVPVPSAPAAVRARGHDHARRLAAVAACGVPGGHAVPLLAVARGVADQSGLSSAERAANLAGALVVRRPLTGRCVVVVDDVVTTGATLVEAARALRVAGATVHGAAVVAATRRRVVRVAPDGAPLVPPAQPVQSPKALSSGRIPG